MKLTQLPSGLSAVITRIDLPPALADRLEALGLWVGEDIEFVRSAPLQDPAEYSVGGSLIALRRPDAARIYVAGFQHLQLNKSSKYRRNAVFFCQIPLSFTLYMLYNYGGLYLIWR